MNMKTYEQRHQALTQLKNVILKNREAIQLAIQNDFSRSPFETDTVEINVVIHEINYCLKNLKKWMQPKKVKTNLANWPAKSYQMAQPYGRVLIIGAWNYPFQLTVLPAVGALAAGNSVVLKPSELAANTAELIEKLINENFDPQTISVKVGGLQVSEKLLSERWDKIFFTGSTRVGQIVYQKAAENLTPVTLELGGKSPAIFDESCEMGVSVKRMVWAKFLNAGQTCIAPDFVYVHESRKEEFLQILKNEISQADYSIKNENYVEIINEQHTQRLVKLINNQQVVLGGKFDIAQRWIEPTVMTSVRWSDPVMQEEIFGPLLPVLTFSNLQDVVRDLKQRPAPLSLYFFTENKDRLQQMSEFSFGGGAINEAIMHFANPHLPFGGVGSSGIGQYHGAESFRCFSHFKSVLVKSTLIEFPFKYSPMTHFKKRIISLMLRLG